MKNRVSDAILNHACATENLA